MRITKNDELISDLYLRFRQRCNEVDRYIEFVNVVVDKKATLLAQTDEHGDIVPIPGFLVSRDLVKTLNANTYVLLYNLVEATMTTALDTIHQAIALEKIAFEDLSEKLQKVALLHFKRAINQLNHDSAKVLEPIQLTVAMAQLGYDKRSLFSGNVDASEIRDAAERYGFISPDPNTKGRAIAKKMGDIREKRNALAHGRLSFEQCGQDTAIDTLSTAADQTKVYLRAVLRSVSKYIRGQTYRHTKTQEQATEDVSVSKIVAVA